MRNHRLIVSLLGILSVLVFTPSLCAQNKVDENGKKQGKWVKYSGGYKVYEGAFIHGVPNGEFLYYYPSGNVKIRTVFSDEGRLNRTKMFFDNWKKQVQAEGNYIDRKKDSIWNYYNNEGTLVLTENYKNGLKNGALTVYNYLGVINLKQFYQNDTLTNISTEYFENGAPFREITYEKGSRNGMFKLFYPQGGLLLEGNYQNDIRDSIWTTYTEKGDIEFLDYYKGGLLIKRTDKHGKELELKAEEETKPLDIDPSKFDPEAIKR